MASKHASVAQSIRDDFLTCNICLEVYTDPRILTCLHTYCFQCVCSHVDTARADDRSPVCPDCRSPITEVRQLKSNFFIKGLTEVLLAKSETSIDCTACSLRGNHAEAKVKCLDCGDYLCSSCSDGHNASSLTWKHEKIPLDDIKKGKHDDKLRQLQNIKCSKHEDKCVEFYCETCSEPVCLTCVLIVHRDHKFQTVADAVSEKKDTILGLTNNIREDLSKLVLKEDDICKTIRETSQDRDAKILAIEEKAQKEIEKIVAAKEHELEQVQMDTLEIEKVNENALHDVKLQKGVFESCLTFCDNILDKGRAEEILMLEKMIMHRLGQLKDDGEQKVKVQFKGSGQLKDMEQLKVNEQEEKQQQEDDGQAQLKDNGQPAQETSKDETEDKVLVSPKAKKKKKKKSKENGSDTPTSDKDNPNESEDAGGIRDSSIPAKKNLTLKMEQLFIAQNEYDERTPEIKGIAFHPDTGIVMSDKANKCLKVYSVKGELQNILTNEPFIPFAVAIANDVIGACSENYLCLFQTSHKGRLLHKVLLHRDKPNAGFQFTYALAASGDEFIVGNIPEEQRLRVYSSDGNLKRFLNYPVQTPLASLTVSSSKGDILMCEWGSGCVKALTASGGLITRCRRTATWKPNQACMTRDGKIIVADYDFGGVCIFNKSGELLLEFKTQVDSVKPTGVVFDDKDNLIVVGKIGYVGIYRIDNK